MKTKWLLSIYVQTSKRAEHVRMPTIPGGDGEPELPAPESGSIL